MKICTTTFTYLVLLCLALAACMSPPEENDPQATYRQWHKMALSFEGPASSEQAADNPFLNYRMLVTFRQGEQSYTVPGFYAADGNAAETSADSGAVWQVRFMPDNPGTWNYEVSFRQGDSIAISNDPSAGSPVAFDGTSGSFEVLPTDKQGSDFRAKGRLKYIGQRYLQHAGDQSYFLKGGTDSPENLLAYEDFDGTYFGGQEGQREGEAAADKQLHRYQPHVQDWNEGDPAWQGGKGKGLIGLLNYLAANEMNSIYFLTLNIGGDGKDVWPYTSYNERYRFDVSKLDQWERVFDHADSLGIMLHFVTQETENETLLDNGNLGPERKLYYRELIARFAHHPALSWNMGEENGYADFTPVAQTDAQRCDMFAYFKQTDPYQNLVVLHTHANPKFRYQVLEPLLGNEYLDGPSLQIGNTSDVHSETLHWLKASADAGKQWVVNLDEIGPHYFGALPDDIDPAHDTIRNEVLWGNLMAGGGGVEWYFGYRYPNDDLNAETLRTRQNLWDQTRHAIHFFKTYLPFHEMQAADELVSNDTTAYGFAQKGKVYAIYASQVNDLTLDISDTDQAFRVQWYDPRNGGQLQEGSLHEVKGPARVDLGQPPAEQEKDWVILLTPSE
ncbi:MAG: DUF5060 domain-containing protein [Cyclobacteriaceae bacterium]